MAYLIVSMIITVWGMLYIFGEEGKLEDYSVAYFNEAYEEFSLDRLDDPLLFTIRNGEGMDVEYAYTANIKEEGGNYSYTFDSGTVFIPDSGEETIELDISSVKDEIIFNKDSRIIINIDRNSTNKKPLDLRRKLNKEEIS
ncbi:hypothetical protein ACFLRF_02230 [Candidatus Altiarchaeota archaeon]